MNDLATTHPQLLTEWHPENNIDPTTIGAGNSRQQIRWVGACGHSWNTAPYNRKQGKGCPYCAGRYLLPGVNDLTTVRPDLAAEWHPDNPSRPADVQPGSDTTVLWLCDRGHTWPAQVKNRNAGYGCPRCTTNGTSGAEQAVLAAVRAWLPDAAGTVRLPNTTMGRGQAEADIVGTYRGATIVIEYDGEYWHRDREDLDRRKTEQILSTGAHLIRVREHTTTHRLPDVSINHPRLTQLQHPNTRATDTATYQHLAERIRDACDTMLERAEA
ncbi:zinc-ribbon domain-containing protein [Curtobacterium sp. MCSS17_016]|uniref:zinc-ribbon domain-containing protein n=1 Tax=Curtobacterium sp. MCSS17_016 TaxID=2175644 RepID=UPI0021AC7D23|nr:zinc-ribbon domain-containing protein [Curtobacterium sp. MCSS17_016]WIE80974.1 zinc-ribbon domain-containing protein [Curtobacterium sp. MCSS17_016]